MCIRDRHYFSYLHEFVTAAAPIHDVRGRVIGLLGMILSLIHI